MILVTVGAQMPFDRLVRTVDEWAGEAGRTDVFAQIGPTDYRPRNMEFRPFLEPQEFKAKAAEASLIIGHAGMGTILTALQLGKPLLVMPRRGHLSETRNDHQWATTRQFKRDGLARAAADEAELRTLLQDLESIRPAPRSFSAQASPELIATIREFVNGS